MDISLYFDPVSPEVFEFSSPTDHERIFDVIKAHKSDETFPDLDYIKLAIIGISEDRGALLNKGCAQGPDHVRRYFYNLFSHWKNLSIADLGNIKRGHAIEDTYFAVKEAIAYLLLNNITPIIIGGSQDLTYANYLAYEDIGRVINIATVDPLFDLGNDEHELNSRSYLSRIILHQPNFLFAYTNVGYQTYFVDKDAVGLMKNLLFDVHRLGKVNLDMEETEPMIRNADILSIDVSAIRASDAPGNFNAVPNGFYGEEVCRICRYAGISDKLSSIGFYEFNPEYDNKGQTAHLIAQMIWYFIDGYMNRKDDFPEDNKDFMENYVRFIVKVDDFEDELIFLKSKKTDRWWMQVTIKNNVHKKYKRHQFVPCSYNDYKAALNQEIPDRWWKVQQKLI
jgi:arginase family enzyme